MKFQEKFIYIEYDWSKYMETVNLGVNIQKNGRLHFFSLKTNFWDLKLNFPFQYFIDT